MTYYVDSGSDVRNSFTSKMYRVFWKDVQRLLPQPNISEDTQEIPQSRNTVFPRHQKKER